MKRTALALSALALAATAPLAIPADADARTLYGSTSTRCYEDGSCVYRTYLTIDRMQSPLQATHRMIDNLIAQHVGPDAIVDYSRVLRRVPLRVRATGSVAGVKDARFTAIFTRAGFNRHRRSFGYVMKVAIHGEYCRADALCERN